MASQLAIIFYTLIALSAVAILCHHYRCCRNNGIDKHLVVSLKDNVPSVHPISVIIPTLNEDVILPAAISRLFDTCTLFKDERQQSQQEEPTVIVVNAGCSDNTRINLSSLMAAHPTLYLVSFPGRPSRGSQQNFGAARAAEVASASSILLFLHADTLLPRGWDKTIHTALSSNHPPTIGSFTLSLPDPISSSLRVMLWGANIRARWCGLPYGDQGYFLTRQIFEAVEGFPNVPIMEDIELLGKIRKVVENGRVKILDEQVLTSPRRWNKKGVLWNTVLNQILVGCWLCGVSHETIYRWYYGQVPVKGKVGESPSNR